MAREYRVYVVELSKKVFTENRRFREANPQFNGVLQCLYVGMTSKTPKERFQQHKTGYRNKKGHKISSNIVQKYGLYLRPSLYNLPRFCGQFLRGHNRGMKLLSVFSLRWVKSLT